jgi:hypothetical protein
MPRKAAADFGPVNEASLLVKPPDQLDKPERELFLDIVTANAPSHFTRSASAQRRDSDRWCRGRHWEGNRFRRSRRARRRCRRRR